MNKRLLKILLLILFVFGAVAPNYFFALHIAENGFDLTSIYQTIAADKLSAFGWTDVVISIGIIIFFAVYSRVLTTRQIVVVVLSSLLLGGSAGLPLLLYFLVKSNKLASDHTR